MGILGFFFAIATAWLLGERNISELFEQLYFWQENPPFWISAPEFDNSFFLFLPTIILFCLVQIVIKLSPQPKTWSRMIIVAILLALTIRYILWRLLSTLNLSNPIDGTLSIALLLMEILAISGGTIQLCLMMRFKERHQEAQKYSQAVKQGIYQPSVDILIPTFNEPEFVLRRSIVGCQGIDYPNKKVYLLDDTKRPEIKRLARELGCYYITRSDNRYAKAGNLNHALTKTNGELIVVFDADFVPTTNFLTRTVGFFQNQKIALVQTPQSFYNADPIARNLGLDKLLPSEEEIFYRQVQPIKDGSGGVVCSGTSFIVRRSSLQEVGCFVTNSISEDYYTGINLSAKGYEIVYLNEKLSAGLAAESMSAHVIQRLRWARGTLQGFFIDSNPLTISGLNFRQRLAHLEGSLTWFAILPRVFFLIIPILYTFFEIKPLIIGYSEMVYLFLPYYLIQLNTFAWLNLRSRSLIMSDVYAMASCVPLVITIIKVLLNPFGQGFRVTPKGISRSKSHYNWRLASPLFFIFIATVFCICVSLGFFSFNSEPEINIVLVWNIYNLIIVSSALIGLLDVPTDIYESLPIEQRAKIIDKNKIIEGTITQLSEIKAEIELKQFSNLSQSIILEIPEKGLKLPSKLTYTDLTGKFPKIQVKFESLNSQQQRRLIELLFCRPGQWKYRNTPGELQSIWILIKLLFRPIIFLFKSIKTGKI